MNGYIKRSGWVAATLLGCLVLAVSAEGASFDCGKAKSKVEKLICGDAELSKQDEEMVALYGEVLKASSNSQVLEQTQRVWLRYRQTCMSAANRQKENICLLYLYQEHIPILRGSLPTEQGAEKKISQLCVNVAVLVEKNAAFKLEPEAGINPPRGSDYRNLDIDGDGVADSVKTDCGTGECNLEVKLSSGGGYDFGDSKFYLIRYQSKIYALVSYSEDEESKDMAIRNKYHLGRLYLIAPTGAKMVCGK